MVARFDFVQARIFCRCKNYIENVRVGGRVPPNDGSRPGDAERFEIGKPSVGWADHFLRLVTLQARVSFVGHVANGR
jgi:hypothetical protein